MGGLERNKWIRKKGEGGMKSSRQMEDKGKKEEKIKNEEQRR